MGCAYCSRKEKLTKEHIIPDSLLDIFAECDFTIRGNSYFKADPIIKDVCFKCNNEILSKLDNYGSNLIKKYFINEYEPDARLNIDYDYRLLSRWLLKIAYNGERSFKRNTELFKPYLDYIMGSTEENPRISLFAGLAIDTSPMPEYYHDNIKLQVITAPKFVGETILEPTDAFETSFRIRKNMNGLNISELKESFLFRFGSVIFLLLLWKDNSDLELVNSFEWIIENMYPYKLLNQEEREQTEIKRVTHAFNIHALVLIDTDIGMDFADRCSIGMFQGKDPIDIRKSLSLGWDEHVKEKRLKALENRKNIK
ncbi:hypothetical protein [Paenibacillus polysaccharolyticus]|uniref:hypothetical protein n=1 Tax=Paenibacillus polysaccharolyticus TaxID=582692 RepID=UPI0029599607|nr:hypothetical protein [Paenibacillus intestini]